MMQITFILFTSSIEQNLFHENIYLYICHMYEVDQIKKLYQYYIFHFKQNQY